jgi:uncharacterized protein
MKFTLDQRSDVNLVRSYAPGLVRIREHTLRAPCIVAASTLISDWDAPDVAGLTPQHLEAVFALEPDVVLVGGGSRARGVPPAVRAALEARGIGLETMDLGGACRTYNVLVQEERRVVALLFVGG